MNFGKTLKEIQMKNIYFVCLILIFNLGLSGCGTVQNLKDERHFAQFTGPESGSEILVAIIGTVHAFHVSSRGGALFGPIGAIVELNLTSDSSQKKGEAVSFVLVQAKIDEYLAKQILAKIESCGIKGSIRQEMLIRAKEWIQKTTLTVPNINLIKASYIIEISAPNFVINDGMLTATLSGESSAKVFRSSDGVLINKMSGSNAFNLLSLSYYSDGDKEKFEELIKVAKVSTDDIASKLSQQICRVNKDR